MNVQDVSSIAGMNWNFENENYWLSFMNKKWTDEWKECNDTVKLLTSADIISSSKHLEMPNTWVDRIFLSNEGFLFEFYYG